MTTRNIQYGTAYWRAASRLGIGGTSTGQKVLTLGRALSVADTLPGPDDVEESVPPVGKAWVRQVPGTAIWLWYNFTDTTVTLRALTTAPPER